MEYRSPRSPRCSIRRSEDSSWITQEKEPYYIKMVMKESVPLTYHWMFYTSYTTSCEKSHLVLYSQTLPDKPIPIL